VRGGNAPLQFRTEGLGRPHDVRLVPLSRILDQRFTIYWNAYTPAEWEARQKDVASAAARHEEFVRRTIDAVDVNNGASEIAHGLQTEKNEDAWFDGLRGRAAYEGWFGYRMRVLPDGPVALVCTYPGRQNDRHEFDVLVDGRKIASERLEEYGADRRLDREYPIPVALTRGKSEVTVTLQAHARSAAGALLELRTTSQ